MPDVGIIEFYLHPPIGLLTPHIDFHGPYSGNRTVTVWSDTAGPVYHDQPVSATYGVQVQLNGPIPIGYGFETGWVSDDGQYDESRYFTRLVQLIVQHQFAGGAWITTQKLDVHTFPVVLLWDISLPGRIGLLVAPGLEFDLFFLTTV
jgi:hypothetical protein